MSFNRLFILLVATTFLCGGISAQKTGSNKKTEKQKTGDFVSIYLKKKLVHKFTRSEYLLFRDSINFKTNDALHKVNDHKIEWKPSRIPFKTLTPNTAPSQLTLGEEGNTPVNIYKNDRLVRSLQPIAYKKFKDSIVNKTKDTLYAISDMRVEIHAYLPVSKTVKTQQAVFVNAKGYVTLLLPLVKLNTYRIVFFADATEIFQVKKIREPELILDKTNFIHAGWFSYELFENEKLKEKGRLFLPK